jgi:hypothetical protein
LPSSGLRVVGSATSAPEAPVDTLVGSTSQAELVLVGVGVDELARRPEVDGLFRTLTWAVPLDGGELSSPAAGEFARRVVEIETALRQESPAFAVHAPLDDLAAAHDRATRASRRQLVVGGQSIVLFVAFAVLAASAIRRSARETRFRLRRLRALRWQLVLEQVGYAIMVALPAVILGFASGLLAGAAVAAVADRPAGDAVRRGLSSPELAWALVFLSVAAVVSIVVTVRAATLEVRGRGITSVDVAVVAALAAIAAALAFGETDAESLAREGATGPALLLLPVLVALAAALLVARMLPPVLRLIERRVTSSGARLALLSLVRNPGAAGIAVACLTLTVGMAVFALTYRATLGANQRDAAAYAAPLGFVVSPDPTRASRAGRTAELAPLYGRAALGVIRRDGEAPTLNRSSELSVLGLPPDAFERMRWRGDYASRSAEELGRAVVYEGGGLRSIRLPRDGMELVVPRVVRGDPIRISAQVRRRDGGFSVLNLVGATGARALSARIPSAARGGTLVGLTLGFPPGEEFTAAHRATGNRGAPDVFLRGTVTVERPRVRTPRGDRRVPIDFGEWVSSEGTRVGGRGDRVRLRYLLTQERTFRIRPRQPTDDRPIPVIASTSIADAAGSAEVLPIRVGGAEIEVEIVATARRFPTLSGDFLVADRQAVATAANASVPGAAVADEAWLSDDSGHEAELGARAPFPLRVVSRAAVLEGLRADPVSRAASIALLGTTLVAACLALVGMLLALAVDSRDDAAELFDLESLGFGPARLARHLWLRSATVLGAGIAAGLVTGALASLVITDVVAVTANATPAEPPLVTIVPWQLLAVGMLAFALLALSLAGLLARRPFTAAAPARPEAA